MRKRSSKISTRIDENVLIATITSKLINQSLLLTDDRQEKVPERAVRLSMCSQRYVKVSQESGCYYVDFDSVGKFSTRTVLLDVETRLVLSV